MQNAAQKRRVMFFDCHSGAMRSIEPGISRFSRFACPGQLAAAVDDGMSRWRFMTILFSAPR